MKDIYPTRKSDNGYFIERSEPVVYTDSLLYQSYERMGYIHIKDFFSIDSIQSCLHSKAEGFVTKEPLEGSVIRTHTGVHKFNPYDLLAKDEDLLQLVKGILGDKLYIHQSRINYKTALTGSGWIWHSDFETWHAQDGMPSMRCLSAMIPLTENTECNGSLMVIPGSHLHFYSCKKEAEVSAEENFAYQKEGVPPNDAIMEFFKRSSDKIDMVKCNPGDLVLFDCNLMHVSTQNLTSKPRTNLFFVYNHISNKLVEPFSASKPRPEEMGSRINIEIL
jgi:ectoine hydroxylase